MTTTQREFKKAYDEIILVLETAQEYRRERDGLVHLQDEGPVMGWAFYERLVVWGTVNRLRLQRGFPVLPLRHVTDVEQSASGHVDYTHKFALRSAELVFREDFK
jgi:hypothetical protein